MNLPVLPQSQPGGHLADRERRASRLSNQTPPQLPAVLTDLKHSLRLLMSVSVAANVTLTGSAVGNTRLY
jgi:hypothetical protein